MSAPQNEASKEAKDQMAESIRKGVIDASLYENAVGIFGFQVLILSIAVGVQTQSWWLGLGSFVVAFALSSIRGVGAICAILIGVASGFLAQWGAHLLMPDSVQGPWAIGAIVAIVAISANWHTYQMRDV